MTHLKVTVLDSDDGQKTCPKHVEFYSKNKFEKLLHLVGFIIKIYYDAWSSEWQTGLKLPVFQANSYMLYNFSFRIMPMISSLQPSNGSHFSIRRVNTINA